MKHTQEVSKSWNLQAVKIQLGHFLTMFHVWQLRIKLLKLPIFTKAVNGDLYMPSMGNDLIFLNKYWSWE